MWSKSCSGVDLDMRRWSNTCAGARRCIGQKAGLRVYLAHQSWLQRQQRGADFVQPGGCEVFWCGGFGREPLGVFIGGGSMAVGSLHLAGRARVRADMGGGMPGLLGWRLKAI